MKKWMIVAAIATLAGFLADSVSAQEVIAAPATEVIPVAPRGGLFRRARERRMMTVVSQPMPQVVTATPAPVQQAQTTEAPKVVTMPMTTTPMTQPQVMEVRRGLFGRVRYRQ